MREVHRIVSKTLGFPCLLQGQGSNAELLDRFRRTQNCVLFATASFWQGVDVPGEQLSCVIVDKLPFAVPTDSRRAGPHGADQRRRRQRPSGNITFRAQRLH